MVVKGSHSRSNEHPKRRRNIILIIVAVLVIYFVALGITGFAAVNDVDSLRSSASTLKTQIKSEDKSGLTETSQAIADSASDLNAQMNNPAWIVTSWFPVIGSDIKTVRTLANVADDLASNALMPAVSSLNEYDISNVFSNGKIDVDTAQALCDAAATANDAVQRSNNSVSTLSDTHFDKVNSALVQVKDLISKGAKVTAGASSLDPVLSDMLGKNKKRRYVLVAQNNAELRSTGGFPGAWSVLTVDNGKISLKSAENVYQAIPAVKSNNVHTSEEYKIFSFRADTIPGDTGQIPDFSRVCEIWSNIWKKDNNPSIQGIIAVDPVFLQDLLKDCGSVTASNGQVVDGTNAAQLLLNDTYKSMPIEQTDAFFAEVASLAFQKILGGIGSASKLDLLNTISDDMQEGRLLMWAKNNQEQSALRNIGCTGELSNDQSNPVLGVYTTEFCWSKIAWYLSVKTSVSEGTKNSDGSTSYDVTVTYKNNLTRGELSKTNTYITGYNTKKRSTGDMIDFIYLVAPAGGTITNVKSTGYFGSYSAINEGTYVDGKENDRKMAETTYRGHQMWCGATQIKPQKTTTISFTVTTSPNAQSDLQVDATPLGNTSY